MNPSLVCDRDTFIEFLRQLRMDLNDSGATGQWENADLACFLEAIQAWVIDWQQPLPGNPWEHAATLLAAAKIYE
ncbi:hypothetical protein DTW90_07695 [Neorhizobium sp. P12A]|jgi:hypothetical protein|nr:hypothetical protein DTW90_07695 [Neorhizobium sp. P12A]